MPIKRILLATDGSRESDYARRWAEMIAIRFGARMTVLSVLETLKTEGLELPADLNKDISAVHSEIVTAAKSRLARMSTALEKKGIQTEIRIATGAPPQEIIKTAQDRRADLIVMGKRGLTGWGKMLLGSTTSAVLREARVPVLTVRLGTERPNVKKILFPTAFSPAARAQLTWAFELAEQFGAVLHLLHVIEVHKSYETARGGFVGRLRDSAAKQMQSLVESIPAQKRKAVTLAQKITASPRAWSEIIGFADEQDVDLIVMGTNARTGVPKLFLGSVAEDVIQESPCPVVTVRE
jgi:nucleotide-binding universal stress UspA family protein